MPAAFTGGLDSSGRESLVVVVKGTFALPENGGTVTLLPAQLPLIAADTFSGAPGRSSPLLESEFALTKGRCDLLLHGTAHASNGRSAERVPVEFAVGGWSKRFVVVGDRHWIRGPTGLSVSRPRPFVSKPISYDVAFGGASGPEDSAQTPYAYPENPVGRGFRPADAPDLHQTPLPDTEAPDQPVESPSGDYRPMSFGPIGRNWAPRARLTGTYDDHWRENVFPFLPADFDPRYFQAAPEDQQIPIVDSPLPVRLINLTPDGRREFEIPRFNAMVTIQPRSGPPEVQAGRLDTILFEPSLGRFSLVWRVSRPLRQNLFEIAEVMIGARGSASFQARKVLPFPIPVVADIPE